MLLLPIQPSASQEFFHPLKNITYVCRGSVRNRFNYDAVPKSYIALNLSRRGAGLSVIPGRAAVDIPIYL